MEKDGVRRDSKVKFSLELSAEQKLAKAEILNHPISFIVGPAGSGKSLLACQIGLDMLTRQSVQKIIITRPTVSTQDDGFLPGSLKEKMEPWLVPIRSNMRKIYNKPEKLLKYETDEDIELISIAHFRGRSFDNAICIVDEFQNLTRAQFAMCIGRLGKGSMMIFCGDREQIDLKNINDSAYHEISKIEHCDSVVKCVLEDNHRHPALTEILKILSKSY